MLRAKVAVTDDSPGWRLTGLIACGLSYSEPAFAKASAGSRRRSPVIRRAPNDQRRLGDRTVICVGEQPARWLLLAAAAHADSADQGQPQDDILRHSVPVGREVWRQLDIISGLPQIYAATSEEFVAQMLNLDVLGAIAFDKGCYTGQEVIARAHYRGRVKRRLQRFRSRGPLDLGPGDNGELADGRAFTVVEAMRLGDGRCEFLAVAPLPTTEPELSAAGSPDAMLERVSAPLGVRPSHPGAAALARSNVGAPATGRLCMPRCPRISPPPERSGRLSQTRQRDRAGPARRCRRASRRSCPTTSIVSTSPTHCRAEIAPHA